MPAGSNNFDKEILLFTTPWADSTNDKFEEFFSYFSQKIGFDISCKLSPMKTICMRCQSPFSEKKNKENISKCLPLKFLPSMPSIKVLRGKFALKVIALSDTNWNSPSGHMR